MTKQTFKRLGLSCLSVGMLLTFNASAKVETVKQSALEPLQMQKMPQVILPSFADLVEKLQPMVVNISTSRNYDETEQTEEMPGIESSNPRIKNFFSPSNPQQISLGSGFIIGTEGYIVTNSHVIDQAKEITVTLADNRQTVARLIGLDKKTDIALIKIDIPSPLPAVELGDSDKIRVGDWILAIGNPFGLGGSVTAGIVSAKSRDIESGPYDSFIQTDASINQGSSGGPMFDMAGKVIGINTAIFSTNGGSMGIGFAVPINLTKFVINELKNKGKVERGWIGIKIQPNSGDIADSLMQNGQKGIVVSDVTENSAAQKAGIEAGDIILSYEGQNIDDTKNFSRMVAETEVGKNVKLEIWRGKKIITKEIPVQLMPEEKNAAAENISFNTEDESQSGFDELGMRLSDLSPDIINKYHLNNDQQGVVIEEVRSGSDADAKGLKSGTLITQVDKKAIFDTNDVKTYINEAKMENHRPVLLLVTDNNVPHYVAIKLNKNE